MRITINSKSVEVEGDQISVADLIALQQIPSAGVAVALNNKVVKRDQWSSATVKEGDSLTVIQAFCGG